MMLDQVERIEAEVEREVTGVCVRLFPKENFEEGRKILFRLYNRYYHKIVDIGVKRNLLYRLIVAEYNCNHMDAVAEYTLILKRDMDNCDGYADICPKEYCDMLSYYCDITGIDLTKDEKLRYLNINLKYYRDLYSTDHSIDTYLRLLNAEFNIKRVDENLDRMLEILKEVMTIEHSTKPHYVAEMSKDIAALRSRLKHIC